MLGLVLGLTYLARQEVVWIGLTLVLLAGPRIAGSGAGARMRAGLALLGPVIVGGGLIVLPWLVRQQLAFGGGAAGQVVDNLLLLRNEQIFALHDTPTLAAFLAQGLGGIAGNIVRALTTQLADTILLGAFPVGIVGITAMVGLRGRPSLRTPSALVVLLLSGAITYVATALLFPVATLWGTFQHASGPLLVGLIACAVLGMDAVMTRISVARRWDPVNVIVGPAALVTLMLPVALIQVASVRTSAGDMERRIEAIAVALDAAAVTSDDPTSELAAPLVSDHPMSLAWVLERPVLVLPDDPPEALGELARRSGARQLLVLDERGRYPEVLLHPLSSTCTLGAPARIGLRDDPAWLFRLDPSCADR